MIHNNPTPAVRTVILLNQKHTTRDVSATLNARACTNASVAQPTHETGQDAFNFPLSFASRCRRMAKRSSLSFVLVHLLAMVHVQQVHSTPLCTDVLNGLSSSATKLLENCYGGSIPARIGRLTKLEGLNLNNKDLTGTIPTEIGKLEALKYLWISKNNNLDGTIPTQIGHLVDLTDLRLSLNSLEYTIPTEIGKLRKLGRLDLHGNMLNETIPTEIGKLTSLGWLQIHDNFLTGAIPSEMASLTGLTALMMLGTNRLAGTIPQSIQHLDSKYIDVTPGEVLQFAAWGEPCDVSNCTTSNESCKLGICCAPHATCDDCQSGSGLCLPTSSPATPLPTMSPTTFADRSQTMPTDNKFVVLLVTSGIVVVLLTIWICIQKREINKLKKELPTQVREGNNRKPEKNQQSEINNKHEGENASNDQETQLQSLEPDKCLQTDSELGKLQGLGVICKWPQLDATELNINNRYLVVPDDSYCVITSTTDDNYNNRKQSEKWFGTSDSVKLRAIFKFRNEEELPSNFAARLICSCHFRVSELNRKKDNKAYEACYSPSQKSLLFSYGRTRLELTHQSEAKDFEVKVKQEAIGDGYAAVQVIRKCIETDFQGEAFEHDIQYGCGEFICSLKEIQAMNVQADYSVENPIFIVASAWGLLRSSRGFGVAFINQTISGDLVMNQQTTYNAIGQGAIAAEKISNVNQAFGDTQPKREDAKEVPQQEQTN